MADYNRDKNPGAVAKIAKDMVGETMNWFDREGSKQNVNKCTLAEAKLLDSILKDNLDEVKPKDKMQMVAYASKSKDENARLIQFSEGQADSRKELTISQIAPYLTPDELTILSKAADRYDEMMATSAGNKSPLQ